LPVSPGLAHPDEFLLWLWFVLDTEGVALPLPDESEVTVMLTRTLVLECPRAISGSETIRSSGPTKLLEACRAIRAGKLPRYAGMVLVRHDQQHELTLQAELLAVSGPKFPAVEDGETRVKFEGHIGHLRHLVETLNLVYTTFLKRRLATGWPKELERIQKWLQREEWGRLAATGLIRV
jgi:hypothetical protein